MPKQVSAAPGRTVVRTAGSAISIVGDLVLLVSGEVFFLDFTL